MKKLAWILAISDPLLRRTALRSVRARSVIDRSHGKAYRDRPALKADAPEWLEPQGGVGGHFEGIEEAAEQRADLHRESEKGTSNVKIRKKKASVKARRNQKQNRSGKRHYRLLGLFSRGLQMTGGRRSRDAPRNPEFTDVGNTDKFIARYSSDLRYCAEWEKWLVWDGRKWEICPNDSRAARLAIDTVRTMLVEARQTRNRGLEKWAAQCHDMGRIRSMVHMASKHESLAVDHNDLDANNDIINVENGIIDLRTGLLGPHDRSFLCTKIANVSYDPTAICPRWIKFLETSMQDPDMINMLQRIAGYTLTGDVSEQCLFFFYGGGSNGKTTFLSTLQKILGDYAQPAPRGLLESDRNNDHDTRIAYLYRARLVICSEVESGKHIAEALVKDLTGGERISARRMREDPWSFDPTAKIIVAGNHKPVVAGQDHGFWRRMKLIPWTITIEENQKDQELLKKLEVEYQGILNWAVMGCVAWKTDGSGLRTNLVDKYIEEYKEEQINEQLTSEMGYEEIQSLFEIFCIERLELHPDYKTTKKKIMDEYYDWCAKNKTGRPKIDKLYSFLRKMKVQDKTRQGTEIKIADENNKHVRAMLGVRVKTKLVLVANPPDPPF